MVAADGQIALDVFTREEFDVVLMDVQMPVMDGFQATEEIRRLPSSAKRQVPIIAMTAHVMPGDKERCLAAGMDEYISKPVDRARLIECVEKIVVRVSVPK